MSKIILTTLLFQLTLLATAIANKQQPNILIVYADDIGNGDLSLYGQEHFATPNIDKLAKEGMRFSNFYGCTVCATARASLLTGRTNAHNPRASKGGLEIQLAAGIITQETFDKHTEQHYKRMKSGYYLGQLARDAGYTTAYFGKLGIGYTETAKMIDLYGFDHHVGLYGSVICWGFYPEYYWDNGKKIPLPNNPKFNTAYPKCPKVGNLEQVYTEDIWIAELERYLEEKQAQPEQPFFAIYATQLPHGPASISEKDHVYKDKKEWQPNERIYASMMHKLDQSIARIQRKLEELNLDQNTILIFMGDNGHEPNTYLNNNDRALLTNGMWDGHERGENLFNGTLGQRGIKRFNHEGGLKIPFLIKWPGQITPNQHTERRTAVYDIMPTIAEIIGAAPKLAIDGVSFLPTLTEKGEQQEAPYLHWINSTGLSQDALIQGDWKLILEMDLENSDPKNGKRIYKPALYHLTNDPQEKQDLSKKHPKRVETMLELIEKAKQPLK